MASVQHLTNIAPRLQKNCRFITRGHVPAVQHHSTMEAVLTVTFSISIFGHI